MFGRSNEDTAFGLTTLARRPERWPELFDWLIVWLPDLLRATGLPEAWAGDLRDYVAGRLPSLGDRRLSEALADWLKEFASRQGKDHPFVPLTPSAIRALVEARSVEDVLRDRAPGEPDWARAFRERARALRPASAETLLSVEPEGRPADDNFRAFRRALYTKAEERAKEYQDKFGVTG